jgi:hypothetical protein
MHSEMGVHRFHAFVGCEAGLLPVTPGRVKVSCRRPSQLPGRTFQGEGVRGNMKTGFNKHSGGITPPTVIKALMDAEASALSREIDAAKVEPDGQDPCITEDEAQEIIDLALQGLGATRPEQLLVQELTAKGIILDGPLETRAVPELSGDDFYMTPGAEQRLTEFFKWHPIPDLS